MRRRNLSPLAIRRIGYALMALAGVLGALSGAAESTVGMILVLVFAIAATGCYVRASDVLLDFDYRGVRRQATLLTTVGFAAALVGCVTASQLAEGRAPVLVRSLGYAGIGAGIAAGLSGVVTMLWSFSGTYAGEQIEKRSNEEW